MKNELPALRAERGWTQADLAAAVRVSRQTIISIERGRFDPSLPLAFALAACFECSIEEIFQPETPPSGAGARPRSARTA
jgi:putative transcriptional regulator